MVLVQSPFFVPGKRSYHQQHFVSLRSGTGRKVHFAIEPVVPYYPTIRRGRERGPDLSLLYGPLKEQLFVYLLCTCTSWAAAAVASQGGQKASVNDEGGKEQNMKPRLLLLLLHRSSSVVGPFEILNTGLLHNFISAQSSFAGEDTSPVQSTRRLARRRKSRLPINNSLSRNVCGGCRDEWFLRRN